MSEQKKVESILTDLGSKIDLLIAETKKAGTKVTGDMEKKIQELRSQKEKLEEQLKSKTGASGEKLADAKDHLNQAADNLRKAFEAIFK